jgi:hypothetical protein
VLVIDRAGRGDYLNRLCIVDVGKLLGFGAAFLRQFDYDYEYEHEHEGCEAPRVGIFQIMLIL